MGYLLRAMVAAQAGGLTPIRGSLQKTAVQLIEAAVFVCAPCPFRVKLGLYGTGVWMSALTGTGHCLSSRAVESFT